MNEFEMEGAHECSKPVISCLEIPGLNTQNCKLQLIEDTHLDNSRRLLPRKSLMACSKSQVGLCGLLQNWANVRTLNCMQDCSVVRNKFCKNDL